VGPKNWLPDRIQPGCAAPRARCRNGSLDSPWAFGSSKVFFWNKRLLRCKNLPKRSGPKPCGEETMRVTKPRWKT